MSRMWILPAIILVLSFTITSSYPAKNKAETGLKNTMLDKVNIDNYLKNERAMRQQIKCILKNGPCDTVGKEMKKLMPHIVDDAATCDECTPNQQQKIDKIVNHLKTNYPNEWKEGVKKYGKSQ